jgi:hypothetical protein
MSGLGMRLSRETAEMAACLGPAFPSLFETSPEISATKPRGYEARDDRVAAYHRHGLWRQIAVDAVISDSRNKKIQ